jgi:DNA-binding NarL/FixJ family response regulator
MANPLRKKYNSAMPGHIPPLDERSLARLREYVFSLRRHTAGALPLAQLVGLARDVHSPAGITLDLRASEQLGTPLVVVRIPDAAATAVPLDGLTPRESQVCALIAEGRSNKQIAAGLLIALATVKDHVHKILQKTRLPNRAALAVAYRSAQSTSGRSSRA